MTDTYEVTYETIEVDGASTHDAKYALGAMIVIDSRMGHIVSREAIGAALISVVVEFAPHWAKKV